MKASGWLDLFRIKRGKEGEQVNEAYVPASALIYPALLSEVRYALTAGYHSGRLSCSMQHQLLSALDLFLAPIRSRGPCKYLGVA